MTEARPTGEGLDTSRQQTIDALCEHFANDALEMSEFERRVQIAHGAETVEDLRDLLSDLPETGTNLPARKGRAPTPGPTSGRAPLRTLPTAPQELVKDREFVLACLGGAARRGGWVPARRMFGCAVMGGIEFDFREARFGPGVTELTLFTMWGGIEVVVPPDVRVECSGGAILGGFDQELPDPTVGDPDGPVLRINGIALMGGVDLNVRYPGESVRDAKRRKRLERKERKRLRGA